MNPIEWWSEFAPQLSAIGSRFRALGVRVSMHQKQFTVLNSPSVAVVKAAVSETPTVRSTPRKWKASLKPTFGAPVNWRALSRLTAALDCDEMPRLLPISS